jgi:hypothetical protein
MQSFGPTVPAPEPEGTVHVALFAEDGSVLFHEEVPAPEGPRASRRYEYEAELRALKGETTQLHAGPDWPPPGNNLVKGKLAALPAVEA